jgi:hypothetical protein|tara:strand:+ start:234 stop:440 length:207 start_codon:yes stop_codon:yes gene_type:complete
LSKKEKGFLEIDNDLNERYVAALLLLSETEDIEVDEAHDMVSSFLKEFELDVDRTTGFTTKENKAKYH